MTTNRHRGWQELEICSVARVRIASLLRSAVLASATVRIVEFTPTGTEKAEGKIKGRGTPRLLQWRLHVV